MKDIGLQVTVYGIKIRERITPNKKLPLSTILEEVSSNNQCKWKFLYLPSYGAKDTDNVITDFYHNNRGWLDWDQLNSLKEITKSVFDLVLIGKKSPDTWIYFEDEENQIQLSDVYIVGLDGCGWDVFSKEADFINRLKSKFIHASPLKPDYLNRWKRDLYQN